MSKPRLLDAYTKDTHTITAKGADYAEVGEWSDGNPSNEDRIGYFVSVDDTAPGITMVKATSTSDVRGATMANPGFSANATEDKYDADGNLLPKYAYVGFIGFVPVVDNGRCTVNAKCVSDDDGTAIPSTNDYGYHVIDRIDANHILVMIEPQGDSLNKVYSMIQGSNRAILNTDQEHYASAFQSASDGDLIIVDNSEVDVLGVGLLMTNNQNFNATVQNAKDGDFIVNTDESGIPEELINLSRDIGAMEDLPVPTKSVVGNIAELKSNFQAGVDSIYNALAAKGATPASKSLSDILYVLDIMTVGGIITFSKSTTVSPYDGVCTAGGNSATLTGSIGSLNENSELYEIARLKSISFSAYSGGVRLDASNQGGSNGVNSVSMILYGTNSAGETGTALLTASASTLFTTSTKQVSLEELKEYAKTYKYLYFNIISSGASGVGYAYDAAKHGNGYAQLTVYRATFSAEIATY